MKETGQIKEDTLVVHEVYASIQGESSFAGLRCTFIRLAGCNLRCKWCDTEHAFYGGKRMARSELLKQALAFDTPLVELTGGEPLLQPGTLPLLQALCDAGKTVLIETSGERDISKVDPRVHRIVDLKAPGSGECHRNRWDNIAFLTQKDEIKIVLSDREDYAWASRIIEEHRLSERVNHILFSCVHGKLDPKILVEWMLKDKSPARFQLQIHKYIWDPTTRAV